MTKCKECGEGVSNKAPKCPHCGIKKPGFNLKERIGGFSLIGMFFLALWAFGPESQNPQNEVSQNENIQNNESCMEDIKCWGEKYSFKAGIECAVQIPKLTNFETKWINGFIEPKFSHFRWKDPDEKVVTYIGDKILFQNSYGAWQNYRYECDFDTKKEAVINVRANPGRLQLESTKGP